MSVKRDISTNSEDTLEMKTGKKKKEKLQKINSYIPVSDKKALEDFTSDGSKEAEHIRAAIRDYVLKETKKRGRQS